MAKHGDIHYQRAHSAPRSDETATHLMLMWRDAEYAARWGMGNESARSADMWAKYHAGQIIGGACSSCGLLNGSHDRWCAHNHLRSAA